ncbi:cob(I)yrinic acid a,c-diamide adenosyltransferase [Thermovibrio sp.]
MALDRGMVHVYTGNGKGKTSAALGLCLRAVGRGLKCCFIQFIKGVPTGEMEAVKHLPGFEFYQTGRPGYDFRITDEDFKRAREGFELALKKSSEVDVLVLDEVNVAVHLGLLEVSQLVDFIRGKPPYLELVLTGRHARAEVIELADYVTYFQLVKHPYYLGRKARKGIDY